MVFFLFIFSENVTKFCHYNIKDYLTILFLNYIINVLITDHYFL